VRTIVHLSDLHFGRVAETVLQPLRDRVAALRPDLIVISGDLTQRARARQFREARAFLDSLPKPQLVVPGNHDVPLWNVFARFLFPYAGYRRALSRDLEPAYVDEEIAVFGVNTAHGFTTKHGKVGAAQLERLRAKLAAVRGEQVRILVMHHLTEELAALGTDVLVAGHVHATRVHAAAALVVQAGTATSSRTREEPNAFNVLTVRGGRVEVQHYELRGGAFDRRPGGWVAAQ
jgi:3',5'-cyclic AMP phosphodiesterase CpdA